MPDLPRLKPVPLPDVHPVPEYAADARLHTVYERTRQGLGVPWMGVVTMAFAHYPRFYETLWSALEPVVAGRGFADACAELRACAEAEARALAPPDLLARLLSLGYDPREVDDIRSCNEVFSAGNMPYLLIATVARLLLEGHHWTGRPRTRTRLPSGQAHARPVLIEAHHADPTMRAVYDDIRETLGLPFVNTDYRAFARWPSYFSLAWSDLKAAVRSADYAPAVERVHRSAVALAAGLPNPTGLTSKRLAQAAHDDAFVEEVRSVVRLFQWLLPGLATNVAFLRAQISGVSD